MEQKRKRKPNDGNGAVDKTLAGQKINKSDATGGRQNIHS